MDFWTAADNITLSIRNTTLLVTASTAAVQNTIISFAWYFAEFSSVTDYLLAFMMNLTGNVVNFVLIFNSITAANNICDLSTVYYQVGLLTKDLLDVAPVESYDSAGLGGPQKMLFESQLDLTYINFHESLNKFQSTLANYEIHKFNTV
jgi:hypothetical protein